MIKILGVVVMAKLCARFAGNSCVEELSVQFLVSAIIYLSFNVFFCLLLFLCLFTHCCYYNDSTGDMGLIPKNISIISVKSQLIRFTLCTR